MKKLLTLIFVTLFLFTSCKEETPSEVEENTEVETPSEVEQPQKVEGVVLTFTSNEKTFNIPLNIPEKYFEPKMVVKESFDWGEYYPILSYSVKDEEKPYHIHANVLQEVLLTDESRTLNDGKENYKRINEKAEDLSSLLVETDISTDYDITIKYDGEKEADKKVLGFFEDRYLIIKIFYPDKFLSVIYLCDLKLNTSEVLCLQATAAAVSPDGEYIIYSSPYADGWTLSDAGIEGEIQKGFYVRDIKSGDTIFFSCKDYCNPYCMEHSISSWLSSENYKSLTETEEIILPEADENTKDIEISFPELSFEEPFTELNLVSPEEFEWGEYVPLVQVSGIESLNASNSVVAMAILSRDASDFIEAREVYSDFNSRYLVEYKPEQDYEIHGGHVLDFPEIADYLYKSRIEYATEDLSRMVRCSVQVENETESRYSLSDSVRCDYIENGEVVYSNSSQYRYWFYDKRKIFRGSHYVGTTEFYKDCFLYADSSNDKAELYSLDEVKMLYNITLPDKCYVESYNRNGMILENNSNASCEIYYYNFHSGELTLIETYAFNSSLSPDGQYVAYTSLDYDTTIEGRENGFYIKNLKSGETVYYPYPYESYEYWNINCWIREDSMKMQSQK